MPDSSLVPMNHVFVDFENIHHFDPDAIGAKRVTLTLMLGAQQTKLDVELFEKLIKNAVAVEVIRLTSSGKNSLDFALAYYLGRKVLGDPTASFHLISRDKGYDPLVEHLRSQNVRAYRHDDASELTFSHKSMGVKDMAKPELESPQDSSFARIIECLKKSTSNRPKKRKTLLNYMQSHLGKDSSEGDATKLLDKMRKAKLLAIGDQEAVVYYLEVTG